MALSDTPARWLNSTRRPQPRHCRMCCEDEGQGMTSARWQVTGILFTLSLGLFMLAGGDTLTTGAEPQAKQGGRTPLENRLSGVPLVAASTNNAAPQGQFGESREAPLNEGITPAVAAPFLDCQRLYRGQWLQGAISHHGDLERWHQCWYTQGRGE
jgi:hypothetical protein